MVRKRNKKSLNRDKIRLKPIIGINEVVGVTAGFSFTFFVTRYILALAKRGAYGGVIEFNAIVNHPNTDIFALSITIFATCISLLIVSCLKKVKDPVMSKKQKNGLILFSFIVLGFIIYSFVVNIVDIKELSAAIYSIIILVILFLFLSLLWWIYQKRFTFAGAFLSALIAISIFIALIINIIEGSISTSEYEVIITENTTTERVLRYGDIILFKDGDKEIILPISRLEQVLKK